MAPQPEAALGLAERDVELEHRHAGLARDAQQARRVDDAALDQRRAAHAEAVGRERLLVVDDEDGGTVARLDRPAPIDPVGRVVRHVAFA